MKCQTILTGEKRKRYHQFLVCRIFQTVAKIRIYNFNIILSMLTLHRHYGSASGPFFFFFFFFFANRYSEEDEEKKKKKKINWS